MVQWVCGVIWEFAETHHINLGRFAPLVFGGMIGHKGIRIETPPAVWLEKKPDTRPAPVHNQIPSRAEKMNDATRIADIVFGLILLAYALLVWLFGCVVFGACAF